MQSLKGRSSRRLQDEIPELRKKSWGQHLWDDRDPGTVFLIRYGVHELAEFGPGERRGLAPQPGEM